MSDAERLMSGRRRGRWAYVSDRYDGPRWRLAGTNLDLEYDPLDGSSSPRGCWILWVGDRPRFPIDHYLDGSMGHVERYEADYVAGRQPDFVAYMRLEKLDRLLNGMAAGMPPELEAERDRLREYLGAGATR